MLWFLCKICLLFFQHKLLSLHIVVLYLFSEKLFLSNITLLFFVLFEPYFCMTVKWLQIFPELDNFKSWSDVFVWTRPCKMIHIKSSCIVMCQRHYWFLRIKNRKDCIIVPDFLEVKQRNTVTLTSSYVFYNSKLSFNCPRHSTIITSKWSEFHDNRCFLCH